MKTRGLYSKESFEKKKTEKLESKHDQFLRRQVRINVLMMMRSIVFPFEVEMILIGSVQLKLELWP